MTATTEQPGLVLMLTDGTVLEDVTLLSTRTPPVYSVTLRATTGTLRGLLATEAQMVAFRDQLDRAIDRARTIDRQNRTEGTTVR